MLFLTYCEVNESSPMQERMQVAKKLTTSGLFPPKGVKILRWDMTADNWGIMLFEADTAMEVSMTLASWRTACPGMFKITKTVPAIPISEGMEAWEAGMKAVLAP
ncbi:MAG: DUF3303 family protein [Bryobacteraceae bacterium]|nr:DUF3303 family protein [Bryobacteraceae bacterium]